MNVFNRNISGGNNNYYMSWRCSRVTNGSYNMFLESYVITSGFSSIWFKFNIDYLSNYEKQISNIFSRLKLCFYNQKRTRCTKGCI